jgi:hypothetical protein
MGLTQGLRFHSCCLLSFNVTCTISGLLTLFLAYFNGFFFFFYRTLYATATRLLCQTWEINDRAFGSLQVRFLLCFFLYCLMAYGLLSLLKEKFRAVKLRMEQNADNMEIAEQYD